MLRTHPNKQSGFMLAPLLYMLALGGIGAAVMFSGYSQVLRSNAEMTAINTVRQQLTSAAQTLSASAALDSATSTIVQPPSVATFASVTDAARLPGNYASVNSTGTPHDFGVIDVTTGVRQIDPWGKYYVYCRWENPVSSASAPSIMVISGGPDGVLSTKCGDTTAQGDDRINKLTVAEAINRANVWQVNSSSQVKFVIAASAVKVNDDGTMQAASLTLTNPLAITSGGTGANTQAGAQASLGVPSTTGSGASGSWAINAASATALQTPRNLSIAGTTGLTAAALPFDGTANVALSLAGTLAIANGGTGAVDAPTARTNLAVLGIANNLSDVANAGTARTNLGLGTMATQNANAVAITGGTIVATTVTATNLNSGNVTITGGSISGTAVTGNVTGNVTGSAGSVAAANVTGCCVALTAGGTGSGTAAGARTALGADNASNLTSGTLATALLPVVSPSSSGVYNWGTVDIYGRVTVANNLSTSSISQGNSSVTVTDTGSNGTITLTTEGSGGITVSPTGNVGINNASPTLAGLQVDKAVGSTVAMFGTGTPGLSIVTSWPGIYFNSYYNGAPLFMGTGYAAQLNFNPTNGDLYMSSSTASGTANAAVTYSTTLFVKGNGNVGIGTITPSHKLDVLGNVSGDYVAYFSNLGTHGAGAQGTSYGFVGYATTAGGNGVLGQNQVTNAYGILGNAANGVYGNTTLTTGNGVTGVGASSGSSSYGVYGQSGSYSAGLGRQDGYSVVGTGTLWNNGAIQQIGGAANTFTGNIASPSFVENGTALSSKYALAGGGNASGTWPISVSGTAQNANQLIGKNWYWSGQGGQPSWVWGGSDGTNMYVYNPSNFVVSNVTALSGTWDGISYFRSNKGGGSYVGGNSSYALEAFSTDGGAAGMSFHRSGAYAVNLGLDPDNVFRLGGWSAAASRWQVDMSGNMYTPGSYNLNGNITINNGSPTIYLQDSDELSAMIHNNSNLVYILRGCGVNSTTWCTANGWWPVYWNLTNNDMVSGGNIYAFNFYHNSDARLKKDIKPLEHGLEIVTKLQGVSYTWKHNDDKTIGLIAQDVEKVLPMVIKQTREGFKSVDYEALIAPLVEAVKDLKNLLDKASDKIAQLFTRVDAHDAELKALRDELKQLHGEFTAYKSAHP